MYPAYSFPDTLHTQIEYILDWTSAKAKKILHTISQGQGNIMTMATKDTKYHIMILQQNLSSFRNMYIYMCIIYIYKYMYVYIYIHASAIIWEFEGCWLLILTRLDAQVLAQNMVRTLGFSKTLEVEKSWRLNDVGTCWMILPGWLTLFLNCLVVGFVSMIFVGDWFQSIHVTQWLDFKH